MGGGMHELRVYFPVLLVAFCLAQAAHGLEAFVHQMDVTGPGSGGGTGVPYSDLFDDPAGDLDGWTSLNGLINFGNVEDQIGAAPARLSGPGLVGPSIFGTPNVLFERADMFSLLIPESIVEGSAGNFDGTATFATTLPMPDETFFLAIAYIRDGSFGVSDGLFVALSDLSPQWAAAEGVPAGLSLWQSSFQFGPGGNVINVGNIAYGSVAAPGVFDTLQLRLSYTDGPAPQMLGGFRFDSSLATFTNPLPAIPINSGLNVGSWDVGVSETTLIPIIPAGYLMWSGLVGMLWFTRSARPV